MDVKFTRSSRKHKIGRASARFVIGNSVPFMVASTRGPALGWIGCDERGRELEIAAFVGERDGKTVVFHVMPTSFRKGA